MTGGTLMGPERARHRTPATRHRHSPLIRRLADEYGVHTDSVVGTGPRGRLRPSDVQAAAAALHVEDRRPEQPAAAMAIADVDVTHVLRVSEAAALAQDEPMSAQCYLLAALARATSQALSRRPWTTKTTLPEHEPLELCVQRGHDQVRCLVASARDLSVGGLARHISQTSVSATAAIDSAAGGRGAFVLSFFPEADDVWHLPALPDGHLAALAVGPVVARRSEFFDEHHGQSFGARSIVSIALTFDGRGVLADQAGAFLSTIRQLLQQPDPRAAV